MIAEAFVMLTAAGAAVVAVESSRRAILRHSAGLTRGEAYYNSDEKLSLKARVEAVYERVQLDLDKVSAAVERQPRAFNISGLKIIKSECHELDVALAVSFLQKHFDSAGEDEVQRVLPMLQFLEQKALERAAKLHEAASS